MAWIQAALEDRQRTDAVSRWLDAGMLSGDDLDVEWLKGLVAKPRLRPIALKLLGDRRHVAPVRVGMRWLLELARSPEADLSTFAQRMLLESFEPADFGGVPELWKLATGKQEAVRVFAATYLKAHHPDLGPRLPEAKALGIKPRLTPDAYAQAIVRPLLEDARADVRRLAAGDRGRGFRAVERSAARLTCWRRRSTASRARSAASGCSGSSPTARRRSCRRRGSTARSCSSSPRACTRARARSR